jgi:hypothetical protein
MAKHLLIENYVNVVSDQRGIVTQFPVILSGTAANLSVGGTSAFTGGVSFTVAPTGPKSPTIVDLTAATAAPTAAQSGSVFLFDRAAGVTVTLPAPVVGTEFTFIVTTTVTSNSYKVITDAGTTFLAGSVLGSVDNTANKSWVGNGTTHLAVTQAAASTNATGGIVGSWLRFTCVTPTLWEVVGLTVAGGTPSTPFATS